MEPLRPFCVEDPVREEQFRTQIPKLRLLTTVPLAPGEEWGTRAEFSPLVEQRDIDFARASLPNVGGITEMLKIMALCDTHKVGIVPHFTGPIATAGHMHTMMAFPGQVLMEYNQGERPVPYMPEFLECRNGKVWPNDRPGLGVSVDEKQLTFVEAMTEGAPGADASAARRVADALVAAGVRSGQPANGTSRTARPSSDCRDTRFVLMSALAILGCATIAAFLLLVAFTRTPVIAALVLTPVVAAVAGGLSSQLGSFAVDGLKTVAPVAALMMFAVLYFGLMIDVGLFAPLVERLIGVVRGDPIRLCLATAALAMLVALDGDGATTFLISITALLPVHRRLDMNPLVLPAIVGLAAGVMNLLPWGGPTARAMSVLRSGVDQIFVTGTPGDGRRNSVGILRRLAARTR